MSTSSPAAPDSARTELETVVNWPLLAGAAGLVVVLTAVPIGMALRTALTRAAVPAASAARPTPLSPVDAAPVAAPLRPIASFEPKEVVTPLPVYREAARPPLPAPIEKPARAMAIAPPSLDPVLQIKAAPPSSFKLRNYLSEDLLVHDLRRYVKDVDLETEKGAIAALLKEMKETAGGVSAARKQRAKVGAAPAAPPRSEAPSAEDAAEASPVFALLAKRPDLHGLPMRLGAECRVSREVARKMGEFSTRVRRALGRSQTSYRQQEILTAMRKAEGGLQEETLSTAMQMFQVETLATRRSLTGMLAEATGRGAAALLARQALFDPSFEVREAAIKALKKRPAEDYQPILLSGLRYPWAPVADHAAEALAALGDSGAVKDLVALLDEPDPCAPTRCPDGKWVVREVVRINHFRNCLLCHAPSSSLEDGVRGLIPIPGKPIPQVYYASRQGYFVRADITYLRQDFSLLERVDKPDKWPEWQRFDYLVRTQELTRDELIAHAKKAPRAERPHYPQKDAVLFALRELTGLFAGENSADWYEALCRTEEDEFP